MAFKLGTVLGVVKVKERGNLHLYGWGPDRSTLPALDAESKCSIRDNYSLKEEASFRMTPWNAACLQSLLLSLHLPLETYTRFQFLTITKPKLSPHLIPQRSLKISRRVQIEVVRPL